jgi:uncharacterized protein (TIGR03083 family)
VVGPAGGVKDCHVREHGWYCDALAVEIERFVSVVSDADPSVPVPTCPDWTLADLVRHVGGVHRWAGQMVRDRAQERLRFRDVEMGLGNGADAAWIQAGARVMLPVLRAADPDAAMWAWGADQHARFWARRMLHETTVHRADAEFALGGGGPDIAADVAVDGIDEFLDNLPRAAYFAPGVQELTGDGETISWRSTEVGERWRITLGPDGFDWDHDDRASDAEVRGAAADLLLLAYGRLPLDGFEVKGDRSLLTRWQGHSSI